MSGREFDLNLLKELLKLKYGYKTLIVFWLRIGERVKVEIYILGKFLLKNNKKII